MKQRENYILICTFLMFSTLMPFSIFAQSINHPAADYICPGLFETPPSSIECDFREQNEYNFISNWGFQVDPVTNENGNLDITNPFPLSQITNWVETHGTPALSNFIDPSTSPPSGVENYVSMYSWVFGEQVFGEGIAQVIPKIEKDKKYQLSFFKKLADVSHTFLNGMDKFYIVLIHCRDYESIHHYPDYAIPNLPVESQVIYVENVSNEDWAEVNRFFIAEDEYDMIWIFPKQSYESAGVEDLGVDFTGIVINEFIDGFFNCNQPLALAGCNFIPNPGFGLIGNPPNLLGAFHNNLVTNWNTTHSSPDIFNSSPPFSNSPAINYARMVVGSSADLSGGVFHNTSEGITAKISPLISGNKYVLSFFVSSAVNSNSNIQPAQNVNFNVALINCQNFPFGFSQENPPLSNPNQIVFCRNYANVGNATWQQVFVSFTANEDFDMIRIYPELLQTPQLLTSSFIYFAFPELLDVTGFNAGTFSSINCTIGPASPNCSVRNAVFTWTDPNGNIIYSGANQTLPITGASLTGSYTLSMSVPNAINVNCDGVVANVSANVNVESVCICTNLNILAGQVSYHKISPPNSIASWVTESISACTNNILCHSFEELLQFSGNSSIVNNNNVWEARIVPGFGNLDANFTVSFNDWIDPNPLQGNYRQIGILNSFNLDLIVPGSAGYTFMVEIRLTNTATGNVKNMFISNIYPGGTNQGNFYCIPFSPSFSFPHQIIYGSNLPGYNYLWTFPPGMSTLTPITNCQIEFNSYTGLNIDPIANLAVTNNYGCDNYNIQIHINPNNCSQSRNMIGIFEKDKKNITNTGTKLIHDEAIQIYPNPTSTNINIESKKVMSKISIYSSDGKLIRTIFDPKRKYIVSLNDMHTGIYLFKMTFEDGLEIMKRIMKN